MQNLFAKSAGVVVAVALLVGVAVPAANALTSSELVELLISLGIIPAEQADSARSALGLSGGTPAVGGGSCYTYTRDLTMGSTGSDVVELQTMLETAGYLTIPVGVSKGYFGSLTASALASWQSANGVSPAVGYFGPITRSAVASMCTPTTTPGTPGTPGAGLSGGEGYFDVDTILDSNIEIDLGDTETVIEVEVEANDSDIQINRVDFMFDARPWLYFDEVNLLVDGDEVASLSRSSDFSEVGSEYRARFTGLDVIIDEDDTVDIGIELVVLDSMAGTRDTDTVNVNLPIDGIRAVDGAGIQQYGPGAAVAVDVTFDEAFGNGDVDVTLGDDSPDNATIVLDEDSRTDDVTVLEFNVEADDSDVEVQDVTVVFATGTGATTSVAQLVNRARLYVGNTLLDTQTVSSATTTFDDIEYDIDEDDTETFRVELDFNKTDGLTLGDFTVVSVKVDAENADFEDVTDTLTVDETHTLVVEGLMEEFVSKSASTQALGDDTIAIFTFDIELTAVENTFYIAEDGSAFTVTLDNPTTTVISTTVTSGASTVDSGNSYRISKGQSESFTVQVQVESASSTQSVRATVDSVTYYDNTTLSTGVATTTLGAPDYRSVSRTVYTQ